jgi:hypothetical protein
MTSRQLRATLARSAAVCAVRLKTVLSAATVALALISTASAATIQIQFTGMDLEYDGSSIFDTGSSNTSGVLDPADADPLVSVDFLVDGSSVGTLSSDISLDVYIPDVTGISDAPGVHVVSTPGTTAGFVDLLIGTSPVAAQRIALDLDSVDIVYNDILNLVQFTFGAALASIDDQDLPFGLIAGEPVTVSFSAQIVPGSETTLLGFVNGFLAGGTGEIQAPAIPEPTTAILVAMGVLAIAAAGRRRA